MLKKIKENKYRIIGTFLIAFALFFCMTNLNKKNEIKKTEKNKINNYINSTSIKTIKEQEKVKSNIHIQGEYFLILEIPKINLKKGIYDFNSKNNTIEKGIEIIEKSDTPNVKNGNLILASHRGNSKVSYFNNLYKLNKNDEVFVYYQGYKYVYKIKTFYKEKKTGILTIKRDETKEVIVLITCVKNENNQVLYIGELEEKLKY